MSTSNAAGIEPTEVQPPGAGTLKEKVQSMTPEVSPWRAGTDSLHLSFQGLYACYEPATAEAIAVRNRIAQVINDNLSKDEWELLRRYHCAPKMDAPMSHMRPEPPPVWNRVACDLATRRAQELYPGRAVWESWVFDLHSELGVAVVLGPKEGV